MVDWLNPEIRYVGPSEDAPEGFFTARFQLPSEGFDLSFEYVVAFILSGEKSEASLEYLERNAAAALKEQLQALIDQIGPEQ